MQVKEVQLFHNTKATGGASKGCGFVYFVEQESAIAAISGMHEKVTLTVSISPPPQASIDSGFGMALLCTVTLS